MDRVLHNSVFGHAGGQPDYRNAPTLDAYLSCRSDSTIPDRERRRCGASAMIESTVRVLAGRSAIAAAPVPTLALPTDRRVESHFPRAPAVQHSRDHTLLPAYGHP
jgi:hypothetical protein